MAGTLSLILIISLLQGALCRTWGVTMPKKITFLSGSCVTVPCSFDVESKHDNDFNDECEAYWSNKPPHTSENAELTATKKVTGKLTEKDCTTTFNNARLDQDSKYHFRLDCGNDLKYTFKEAGISFSFTAAPPSPTLIPSTLEVKEGTPVSLTCFAPAPCWSHPPALTWTPNLGQSQETLQETEDKTKVMISVVSFNASHLHHGKNISCTAVYKKQDGSADATAETSLTPVISYSPKNITVSVSPSGPVPENSKVTLTCSSNANPAVKNYTWYRADGDQETVIGAGTSLNTEVSRNRLTFFCKAENELGTGHSNLTQVEIQFPPQILLSSACNTTASQVNCSCETVGNPSPTVQWYLNGLPVNQSGSFEIVSETLNSAALRSFFTLNQPHKRDLSTVLCSSFNSLGSTSQQFCVSNLQVSAEHQGFVFDSLLYQVIISTLAVLLLILFCVLLFIIRPQKNHCKHKVKLTDENNTVAMSQLVTNERNEAPNRAEESIYTNTDGPREADTAHPANSTKLQRSGPNNAEEASENSDKKGDEREVIYSNVIWKAKNKKKKEDNMNPPGGSYLEEEKCVMEGIKRHFVSNALEMGGLYDCVEPRNVRKEAECEYAQVRFKNKSAMQK